MNTVVMDGVLSEGQSPVDLQVAAHMKVVEGRNEVFEITKEFYVMMISDKEGQKLLTRTLFTMVKTRSFETVQGQLKSFSFSTLSSMGYTAATANLHNEWELSQNLENFVSEIIGDLPRARLEKKQDGGFEVFSLSNDTVQDAVHVAIRLSYHIFIIWNLAIIASHRADDAEDEKKLIFHELLLHRRQHNELVSNAKKSAAAGSKNTEFDEIMESRSRIDEKFLQQVRKELAALGRDEMFYALWQMRRFDNSRDAEKPETDYNSGDCSSKHCTVTRCLGTREIATEVPVLIMKVEGSSYKEITAKQRRTADRSLFILPLVSMLAKLNIHIQVGITLESSVSTFTLALTDLCASFKEKEHNSDEEKKRRWPFFSEISFSVVPVNDSMLIGSVTTTGASPNIPMTFGVGEQYRLYCTGKLGEAPGVEFGAEAAKDTRLEFEKKPWRLEHLLPHDNKGGMYKWTLVNLLGKGFNRLKPSPTTMKSILEFNDCPDTVQLPFNSNWSVNFKTQETFTWRFQEELENKIQKFIIKGRMDITYIDIIERQTVWETRTMPFECELEEFIGDNKK